MSPNSSLLSFVVSPPTCIDVTEEEAQGGESASTPVISSPDFVLSGHHLRVIQVAWSPHQEGRLLSVSYDTTAQVWDVPGSLPVANFSGHQGRVSCCLWSPIDPDVAITGSEDATLRAWRVSKQTERMPQKKGKKIFFKTGISMLLKKKNMVFFFFFFFLS